MAARASAGTCKEFERPPGAGVRRPGTAPWRASGLVAGVALALGALPSAEAAEPESRDCSIAEAIDALTPDGRDALKQACTGGSAPEEALQGAIFRMVSLPGWRSAGLAQLLAPMRGNPRVLRRAGAPAPDLPRAQASLAVRPDVLAGPQCSDLRRAVEAFVADTQQGEPAASPFIHDDAALARCVGVDADALRTTRLVALRADHVEELFVAAAAPDFAWITWLQPRDALAFGRHRFFVVAAPPGAPMLAVARLTNTEVPAVWRGIVSHDEVGWPESPDLTCIDLDVRLGPAGRLYLDGAPVPRDEGGVSRVLTVTRQSHELVALECPGGPRPCHVRYREELPESALQRRINQCLGVRLDLAPRARPTVAILDATQGRSCDTAPLRADGLRRGAAEYLSSGAPRASHDFHDLAAFAAATDALSALRARLNPVAGVAAGPDPGADGADLIGSAAKEAWRQGIDVLLSFDLQCVRREDAWVYRLTATRVALSSMFSRGRHGGGSLDLGSFIESSAEEFQALERLPVALASVIDRSLAVPYLRLLFDAASVPFRRGAALTVQRHAGDAAPVDKHAVVVRARRLNLSSARPELCRRLEQTLTAEPTLLAEAERAFATGRGAPIDLPLQPDRAAADGRLLARSDRAHLRGHPPGWYLVVARWADDDVPRAAACVELTASGREVWADLALSVGAMHLAPSPAPDQLYARTRIGYTHYLRPIVGLGVFAGHGYTHYEWQDGRPAWQDLGVQDNAALVWQRHALLVGGIVELRTRVARLPFDLRLRAAPTLSVGFLRHGQVPPGMTEFLARDNRLDVDLDLHFDAAIGYDIGPVAVQHLLLLGLHAVNDAILHTPNRIDANGGFFIGLGLGLGGAP